MPRRQPTTPPAPVTTYYAPSYAAPVTTYYAPTPVTSYYAPAPVTSYYAPAVAPVVYARPRLFFPGYRYYYGY